MVSFQAFSANSVNGDYCLSHLWTATAFTDGVQGLAWIASAASNTAGGICSPGEYRMYNVIQFPTNGGNMYKSIQLYIFLPLVNREMYNIIQFCPVGGNSVYYSAGQKFRTLK